MELKPARQRDLFWIYRNYRRDFPADERKPFWMLLKNRRKGITDIFILWDNGVPMAYAASLIGGKQQCVLIDYLAVTKKARNKGCGSCMLRELSRFYAHKAGLIVEIEDPEKGENEAQIRQRLRRREFYLRGGFTLQTTKVCLFGVDMRILYYPLQTAGFENFSETLSELYLSVFGEKLVSEKIKIFE